MVRILYAVHALPDASLGGTEMYTQQVAETLATDHDVAVATPRGHETDVAGVEVFPLPDPVPWTDPTGVESGLEYGVAHEDVDGAFADVLDAFDPDVVHFQHLKFTSATLPHRCAEHGVPCLATLHDFWTMCHREQLFEATGKPCSGPESTEKCTACYADALRLNDVPDGRFTDGGDLETDVDVAAPPSAGVGDLHEAVRERTARLREARESVDLFISPSRFLRDRFVAFGTPPERIVHCRNGIRVNRFVDTGFDLDAPLRLGFAGRITPEKGVHLLVDAFERVEGDAELDVFGEFDRENPYHARLRETADDRTTFHGRYGPSSMPYRAMDVLVVPSVWYENSPLVIQEAFASGVPVVAGDIGGMAEMVSHRENGLTFAAGDAVALAGRLQELIDSPALVRRLRAGVEPPKSLDEHARELLTLYAARGGCEIERADDRA